MIYIYYIISTLGFGVSFSINHLGKTRLGLLWKSVSFFSSMYVFIF